MAVGRRVGARERREVSVRGTYILRLLSLVESVGPYTDLRLGSYLGSVRFEEIWRERGHGNYVFDDRSDL